MHTATRLAVVCCCYVLVTGQPSGNSGSDEESRHQGREIDLSLLRANLASTPFRLSEGMNEFAQSIYDVISRDEIGNVIVSPFSLHTALSMVFFGSPSDSETHKELVKLLGMPTEHFIEYPYNYLALLAKYDNLKRTSSVKVQSANKIYVDDTFEPKQDFLDLLSVFYRTRLDDVDFSDSPRAARIINQYVAAKTQGNINNLLEPHDVDGLTRMVIVNAIYFKGDWKNKFDKRQTRSRPFTVAGETFNYPDTMTTRGNFGIANIAELDASVLELPYEDENFRMLIFLPNREEDGAVMDLDSKLRGFDMKSINRKLVYGPQVRVQIPKFKANSRAYMSDVLGQLGVSTLFDPNSADLSDLSDEAGLHVQKVIHQAEVEVNEEGSEASAATAVVIGTRSKAPRPREFIANRPFVFIIQDKEFNVPLFLGRIVDPSGKRVLGRKRRVDRKAETAAPPIAALQLQNNESEDGEAKAALPDCDEIDTADSDNPERINFPCRNQRQRDE
jgi:serpin B